MPWGERQRRRDVVGLAQWHASSLLLVLTLVGDGLCVVLAVVGDLTRRYPMPHIFWWILWLSQIPLALQILIGVGLLSGGAHPSTPYHLMYGALILLTLLALFGLRPGGWIRRAFVREDSYRESRWLALLCLFLAGLVLREYYTGMFGR
jgi:hypothetical protein